MIACSDTKANDITENREKGVHHFVDDYRFNGTYDHPEKSLSRYLQYAFVLTPDFSTYADMNLWRQLESVAKNRWVGAFWQEKGLLVIPTISWSDARSFEFCFDGVEKGSTVAIGMVGCKQSKISFLRGYYAMLDRINPSKIICFGAPYQEMRGDLIVVDYRESRKVVR
ncbi:MAG: DUF4417 domain-containing protein [Clostridia bacterium]|nr:DUF4417 domain-containing protein [Clostridia bacterium]